MIRLLSGFGRLLLTILKWIAKALLALLTLVVEVFKLFLLLFGLVARIFLAFVRGGTF